MDNHSMAVSTAKLERKEKRIGSEGAVVSADKKLASVVRSAIARNEQKKRYTLGLYSLKTGDSNYGIPFCALNDSLALEAAKQLLPLANLYKVGSFCLFDGKCVSSRPVLVLDNKVA